MRIFFQLLMVLLFLDANSQSGKLKPITSPGIKTSIGSWSFRSVKDNIFHFQFRPAISWNNDQYSDAVILTRAQQKNALVASLADGIMASGNWKIKVDSSKSGIIVSHDSLSTPVEITAIVEGVMAGFTVTLEATEAIYGGGERAVEMNRRGKSFPLYNTPSYGYAEGADVLNFSVPFFLSNRGYAIFYDNPSKGHTDIGKTTPHSWTTTFTSGALDCYLILGNNMDEQLQAYTDLTGRQPLPPRWALGHFMSRFGYTSQQQVLEMVEKTQDAGYPLDAVVLDLFWFGDSIKGTMGNMDWVNKQKWPDPAAMIDSLNRQQIKTILITEPFFLEGTKQYEASKPYLATDSAGKPYRLTDFYFGYGGLLDIFRKDAREWFWSHYEKQLKLGVAGWWGDLGEPEKHPSNMYHQLKESGSKGMVGSNAIHNIYGHFWSKMLFEQYSKNHSASRLFFLNRAGFAGSQRYSIFPWTGDVSRSWSGLQAQLPLLQGMSISGIPYIHSDAGGFAGGEMDAELYTRWLQMAVFTPVFRPHGTMLGAVDPSAISIPSEPVLWPDSTQSIIKKFIQLRYDLLPYNYSLAFEQTLMGKPLIRPMNYYSYSDSNLNKATSQYMWGDQLLVAPITEKAATFKNVYFPDGDWYDYFTSRRIEGGQWEKVPAHLNKLPVYAKAGSFIPERTLLKNTEEYKTRVLVIKHYIGKSSNNYIFFDDDGHNPQSLEQNEFDIIAFVSKPEEKKLKIGIGGADRKYKGRAIKKLIVLDVIGLSSRPPAIKLNDLLVPYQSRFEELGEFKGELAIWDQVNQSLRIVFEYTQRPHKLEISY